MMIGTRKYSVFVSFFLNPFMFLDGVDTGETDAYNVELREATRMLQAGVEVNTTTGAVSLTGRVPQHIGAHLQEVAKQGMLFGEDVGEVVGLVSIVLFELIAATESDAPLRTASGRNLMRDRPEEGVHISEVLDCIRHVVAWYTEKTTARHNNSLGPSPLPLPPPEGTAANSSAATTLFTLCCRYVDVVSTLSEGLDVSNETQSAEEASWAPIEALSKALLNWTAQHSASKQLRVPEIVNTTQKLREKIKRSSVLEW